MTGPHFNASDASGALATQLLDRQSGIRVLDEPNAFRSYYGTTMNAFAAAEQNGKMDALCRAGRTVALAIQQNKSPSAGATVIPAIFLKATVTV